MNVIMLQGLRFGFEGSGGDTVQHPHDSMAAGLSVLPLWVLLEVHKLRSCSLLQNAT